MRKTIILLGVYLFFAQALAAQNEINSFVLSAGKSWHGTGDLDGLVAEVCYEHYIAKLVSFSTALTTTIHYGKDDGFNDQSPGITPDTRLMRFTTAGLQISSLVNFAVLSLTAHKIQIGAGPLLRFQSTSHPSQYGYYQNQGSFPEPFYVIYDPGKQNTITAGFGLSLMYLAKINKKYQVGIKASFQNDTNSDVLTAVSLILCRKLPHLR